MSLLAQLLGRVIAKTPSLAAAAKVQRDLNITARVWRAKHERGCARGTPGTVCRCDPEVGEWTDLGRIAYNPGRMGQAMGALLGPAKVSVRYVWRGKEIERANY